MRYQIEHDGSEIQAETELLDTNDLSNIIKQLFEQYSWRVTRSEKENSKYLIDIENNKNENYQLNVFVGNIRDESRNPKEKKIQLNGNDPRISDDNRINIILGVYCRHKNDELDKLIFAGWSIDSGTNYQSNPSLRGISTDLIQTAKIYGFTQNIVRATSVCVFRPEFIFYYIKNLKQLNKPIEVTNTTNTSKIPNLPYQTIFFGAPGTGKSYRISELLHNTHEDKIRRVTFHPEFDYASFVGGYKPITYNEKIKYDFIPQIFTNIYIDAWNDQDNYYYLVIEEINRGNCAEIFGDLFQLLDRNDAYTINASLELKRHLEDHLDNQQGIEFGKMKLPSNLFILATMNTSDQSLYPMDSAFKRRWSWEYIPICYTEFHDSQKDENGLTKTNDSFNYVVQLDKEMTFKWIDFIEVINKYHIKNKPNLGMDKCIGNYFVQPVDKQSREITIEQFINKVIFYLWNDVFKDEDNDVFPDDVTYEDFFPIKENGKEQLMMILENLQINITNLQENKY